MPDMYTFSLSCLSASITATSCLILWQCLHARHHHVLDCWAVFMHGSYRLFCCSCWSVPVDALLFISVHVEMHVCTAHGPCNCQVADSTHSPNLCSLYCMTHIAARGQLSTIQPFWLLFSNGWSVYCTYMPTCLFEQCPCRLMTGWHTVSLYHMWQCIIMLLADILILILQIYLCWHLFNAQDQVIMGLTSTDVTWQTWEQWSIIQPWYPQQHFKKWEVKPTRSQR